MKCFLCENTEMIPFFLKKFGGGAKENLASICEM